MTEAPIQATEVLHAPPQRGLRYYVVLWIIYVALRIQLNANAFAFLFFIFDAFALISGIVWLYHPLKRRRAVLLVACVIVGIPLTISIVDYQIGLTKQRAIPIIAAIERYQADHGRYPETLQGLVPRHLVSIPRTCMGLFGGRFMYCREMSPLTKQERFLLSFWAPGGMNERGMRYWSDLPSGPGWRTWGN